MSGVYSVDDVYRPSFFELVASDRLMSGLKPAIKHLFHTFVRRHPSALWLVNWSDEIFYSLISLLETHYLQEYEASFAENFYGLKRMKLLPHSNTAASAIASKSSSSTGTGTASSSFSSANDKHKYIPLSAADKRHALLSLVLLPYIKSKCDTLYTSMTSAVTEEGHENINYIGDAAQRDADQYRHPLYRTLRRMFIKYYPYIHALYEALLFLYQLRYLFEFTSFYSPWLSAMKQVVRRLSMEDMMYLQKRQLERQQNQNEFTEFRSIWRNRNGVSMFHMLRMTLISLLRSAADYAKWGILAAIFIFKFLEWWYSPSNRAMTQQSKLPVPPPPTYQTAAQDGISLPQDKSLCPLCLNVRVNSACLSSGYVFCYTCLHTYVTAHQRCPVSHRPQTLDMIRRIYDEDS
jgi:peroxin-12